MIVERIMSVEDHEKALATGGYRPAGGCPKCSGVLHIHDYRTRVLLGDPVGIVTVVRFYCARCDATWLMLPALVPRGLWRSWSTVEAQTSQTGAATKSAEVSPRTRQRWWARLSAMATLLVVALATAETPATTRVAGAVGIDGTRRALVAEYSKEASAPEGQRLAGLAALIHRLTPGVRLM